jgi:hypothetical protein
MLTLEKLAFIIQNIRLNKIIEITEEIIMKTTLAEMLIASLDRAMMEDLKVYRHGGVGHEGNFVVINHENVDAYEVKVEEGIIKECSCPHSYHRKTICKHMLKVAITHHLDIEQLRR